MKQELTLGSEHVEAVRLFGFNRHKFLLTSLNGHGNEWVPGEIQEAECRYVPKNFIHTEIRDTLLVPHIDCMCGIWACKGRKGLSASFPTMVDWAKRQKETLTENQEFLNSWLFTPVMRRDYFAARVQMWGRVIEHEWGYRSEYARIIPESIHVWPRGIESDIRVRNLKKLYKGG